MSDRALLDEYHNLLRSDFAAFLVRAFTELHPEQELVMAPHIAVMASRFSDVRNGRIRRLVINVPPRSLKSFIGSVALPAWLLGHDASTTIICASYAQDLADNLARDCRTLMLSEWYRGLFSRTRLTAQKPALQELVTTVGGYRLATSVGGVLTGRGADIIIIDDPLKPEEAMSDTQRQATNAWYDGTLVSRLNDQRHGVIVLIMQRLHEADLTGHVLEQEAWEHLCLPAIAEQDEVHRYMTAWGPKTYCRRAGDLLHPERLPAERLEELKHTMGSYFFAAQFQQRPAPAGGGMVKPAWFKRYTANDQPERFDRIVQSWDTASKVSELADFNVCTTWGIKGKHVYLLHVFRKRLEYPQLKRTVPYLQQLFSANVVLIEDKASGTALIQELNQDGLGAVTRYEPKGDKIMRMHAQTAIIEAGRVLLPTEAPWLEDFLHEVSVFPKGKYDDQVDSLAQFLDWFTTPMPDGWLFDYYREKAEQLRHPERIRVRMRPPPGSRIGHLAMLSHPFERVGPDGIVEVAYDDAKELIKLGWTKVGERYIDEEVG